MRKTDKKKKIKKSIHRKKSVKVVPLKDDIELRSMKLANLIRLHGVKIDATFRLSVSVEVDGRFAEEYEDCSSRVPCTVNWIAVGSSDAVPYFHMYSSFSTNFPLASNDRYAMTALSPVEFDALYDCVKRACAGKKPKPGRRAEINRAKWIGVAESHMPFVWAPEADAGGSSLHFMLDCIYSCFDGRKTNTMFKNIRQIEKNIMSTIDRKTAVLSRVLYPTLSDLSESGYLAMQEDRRYDRWSKIVPKVYARIVELAPNSEMSKIFKMDPTKTEL